MPGLSGTLDDDHPCPLNDGSCIRRRCVTISSCWHDDAGRSHVHAPTLGVGLAGAVLIELAFAGRIALSWSRVVVPDRRPTGDNINDRTLARSCTPGPPAASRPGWA